MTKEEIEWFKKLPDEIRIYRGQESGGESLGYSWTLHLEVAARYARDFEMEGSVKVGICFKKDIKAYFKFRKPHEEEIVVLPESVRLLKEYELSEYPLPDDLLEAEGETKLLLA